MTRAVEAGLPETFCLISLRCFTLQILNIMLCADGVYELKSVLFGRYNIDLLLRFSQEKLIIFYKVK
jgi:hypothetical protein